MTGPDSSHDSSQHELFDELAAGHVLHALEPDDEQKFLAHAASCPRCQQTLASYTEITGALAGTAPPAEPSPQLGERILAATRGPHTGPQPAASPSGIQALPSRRRNPRTRWLKITAATGALAAAAAGIWGGLAATSGNSPHPSGPACGHNRACHQVPLTATPSHVQAAQVIVADRTVWLRPGRLNPDNRASHIYVLWQITGTHTPVAVGSFDIRPGDHTPIRIGSLAVPYRDTRAFAVSLEHGRTIPAIPSRPVALGHVPPDPKINRSQSVVSPASIAGAWSWQAGYAAHASVTVKRARLRGHFPTAPPERRGGAPLSKRPGSRSPECSTD